MFVAEDLLQVLELPRELQEDDYVLGVSRQSIWPFGEALGSYVCELQILDIEEGVLL